MPPTAVRFYFDYVSPNAYLAWTQLPRMVEGFGVDIEPVPVLFAGLLEAHGRVGPAEVPVHIRWMWKNVLRKAAILSVAMNRPASHPFNPLLALRVSSLPLATSERMGLIDALFQAVWVRGLEVSDPGVVEAVADGVGLSGGALVAAAGDAETKARLRKQTDDAIAHNVFGVPSMVVGDELFWGYDDIPYLTLFLSGDDPLDPKEWQKWSDPLVPSAIRKRQRRTN
jgi:2-hydroxychromene-2-carboxylate isomerase